MRIGRMRKAALGAATIAVAVWLMWYGRRPAAVLSSPPPMAATPVACGKMGPQIYDRPPSSEPAVTTISPNDEGGGKLKALVLARLREWQEEDDAELRDQRIQALETLLDGTNLFAIVQELPPDLLDYAFALPALHRRMMSDPKAAAAWMRCHTNIADAHVFTLLHDWGQQDREALREYLSSLPEGEWKQRTVAAASSEVLSGDPVEAIVWAEQLCPGERQTGLLEMAATDWVRRDPDAAAQWVKQINDPGLREQLAGALAIGYADLDPAAAAESVTRTFPPGEVLNRSVAEIAWTWALREPVAAIGWVAQFPEGPARQMALGNVMSIWGNRDRTAALAWVENLPPGRLQFEAATDLQRATPADAASAP
jgi:hypothetical protein